MKNLKTYKKTEEALIIQIKSRNKQMERYPCFENWPRTTCKRLKYAYIFTTDDSRLDIHCSKFGNIKCPDVCNKYK